MFSRAGLPLPKMPRVALPIASRTMPTSSVYSIPSALGLVHIPNASSNATQRNAFVPSLYLYNNIPIPSPTPAPIVAPIPSIFCHEANLLSRNAIPASLFASAVFTTPTFPVRVPIPILPTFGDGAVVNAVAGPCAIGTSPWAPTRPPAAGAAAGAATGAAAPGLKSKRLLLGLSKCGKEEDSRCGRGCGRCYCGCCCWGCCSAGGLFRCCCSSARDVLAVVIEKKRQIKCNSRWRWARFLYAYRPWTKEGSDVRSGRGSCSSNSLPLIKIKMPQFEVRCLWL